MHRSIDLYLNVPVESSVTLVFSKPSEYTSPMLSLEQGQISLEFQFIVVLFFNLKNVPCYFSLALIAEASKFSRDVLSIHMCRWCFTIHTAIVNILKAFLK